MTRDDKQQDRIYTEQDAAQILSRDLPTWDCADGALQRTYRTKDWQATLMVVGAIAHLAEAACHHPDMTVSYNRIGVSLVTHSAGGITDKDFALARKIESVVCWQPGEDAQSPLEGVPRGEKPGYIDYGS